MSYTHVDNIDDVDDTLLQTILCFFSSIMDAAAAFCCILPHSASENSDQNLKEVLQKKRNMQPYSVRIRRSSCLTMLSE